MNNLVNAVFFATKIRNLSFIFYMIKLKLD